MKHKKRFILILDAALLLCALLAVPLADLMMDYIPECSYAAQGITCISCGGTRCVKAFFSLQFGQAFAFHPAVFCILIYLIAALIFLNIGYLFGSKPCEKIAMTLFNPWALGALTVAYLLFGGVRMVLSLF